MTFTVGVVSLTRNSSAELQEILCLGDPDVASSLGIARVTASAPASTNAALNVRVVGGPSSVADYAVRAVLPSTYGDHGLRVLQSTAADLNVTVAGYSTTVNVSSLGGAVVVRSSAADAIVTVKNSTIGELLASVQQNSTVWQVQNKPVFPTVLSTSIVVTSTHSTAVYELVSSAAAVAVKVLGYFVGSTHTNPSTLVFMSSLAIDRWHVNFGSGSSGITGANLANPIPIFQTVSANALNCRVEGGSSVTATVVTRVSVGYVAEA